MSLLNPSFLLGLVVLLYFSSFVLFAILRIATGISIQRIGYFSLRRISYAPREGIRIDIRGLGLLLHRPTFAQPTWITLRLDEFKVTLDIEKATASSKSGHEGGEPRRSERSPSSSGSPKPILRPKKEQDASRSRAWKKLTGVKDQLKRLHEKIDWFRLVDVFADNSSLVIEHVGRFELGLLLMLVDTRRKTVDRTRLFQHKKAPSTDQRPAEWVFSVRGVLFTPKGEESLEILDTATLNIHGLLYKDLPGLRDTSIAIKLGRIHIPYDKFIECHDKIKHMRRRVLSRANTELEDTMGLTDVIEELDRPGSRDADIVQTVSDSKEFISSILRGIQEIQLAVSFIGLTKRMDHIESSSALYLNASMNELGLDLHRLDAKSPAHRMYFSPKDVAHQALLAAISISVALDEGDDHPERILYVPMATTTVKTTLPSKTVAFSEDRSTAERNANILFANLVVTSPSIDLDPKHLPIVLDILRRRQEKHHERVASGMPSHHILSRLLPKANIKLSVHEPVIRVKLPSVDPEAKSEDDYDLLISMVSSISFETESSYSNAEDLQYALHSTLRLVSHEFYYQTAFGDRHDLLLADSIELKAQIYASPAIRVVAFANFQTLSIHMVRPEISSGVRQIVQNTSFKKHSHHAKTISAKHKKDPDFLRPLPPWLVQFSLQGTDWSIDIAGIDDKVSSQTRGIALQLESWTAEYKQRREVPNERPSSRHLSKLPPVEPTIVVTAPTGKQMSPADDTDGRRFAVHVRGLEGFVREANEALKQESFVSLPRFEVAFSTSSDHEGPIFHVNSYFKALYLHYSLYRFYAIGVAAAVLRKAFAFDVPQDQGAQVDLASPPSSPGLIEGSSPRKGRAELVTIDVRSDLLQIKAKMPADPAILFQVFGVEVGQHRWAKPFLRSRMVRFCTTAPRMKACWARVVSIKALRVDLREIKRKRGAGYTTEQSFDVATDFIRIGVPHQLVVHNIFDNFVNVVKATEQLKYRFITGKDDYKLEKKPEQPKVTPRISIRSKVLLFDIEDGPFDWKLGMIYRIGLVEQKQRQAREEAFKIKVRHIEKMQKQGSSRHRHPSTQNGDQRSKSEDTRGRHHESESNLRHSSESPPRGRKTRGIRYDPEGKCSISEDINVTIEEAKRRLNRYNAQSWKRRIDLAYRCISGGMREIRGIFWGSDDVSTEENTERIVGMPERPGLMTTLISDLHMIFDKPSFPVEEYPEFLFRTGKGLPKDTKYSLLIPLHVQIDMGEARMTLRDYPLPILHIPAIRPGQSPRLPSWSLKTDFVIAEEFRGAVSTKRVNVEIVPPENLENPVSKDGFSLVVLRTVSPVKTYSDVNVAINTSGPTTISWGTSLQPAIQDMMMVIEAFSKPQVDPSDRVGFWDKIRLSVHSRISVCWTGDGDVHLNLKGSRDPYIVTGHGAGFVMVWRKDVKWNIHRDDDPKKFMTVDAGEYVLAIPDFSRQAREHSQVTGGDADSMSTSSSFKNSAHFKKTIMKLSGNVRWLAGLVFQRNLDRGGRSFEFRPHYDVMLRPADTVDLTKEKDYDAFRGFRSNWIHLSLAVIAPLDRDWRTTNVEPSTAYNSIHLTPRFFTHFFDWWSMFSGVMSLPIRQGKLFPGIDKSSKKFGRHLATIKYNILVSPLFMTHLYKHKDIEEFADDSVSATGLKLRLDSFMLDIHQRREEFTSMNKDRGRLVKTSAMKIHESQLDFISADLRAISAKIGATTAQSIKNLKDEDIAALGEPVTAADLSRFHIPDNNFDWVDMDDFNELDWMLPSESNPETKILPLAFAPRFTYYRQTDHPNSHAVGQNKSSPFGKEPTHLCVMSKDNDPRKVQCDLVRQRLAKIDEQIKSLERSIGEQELLIIRDSTSDKSLQHKMRELKDVRQRWDEKKTFLSKMLERLDYAAEHNEPWSAATDDPRGRLLHDMAMPDAGPEPNMEDGPLEPAINDFNNRFVIHNIQLKWNNSLRDIILRYVHQVSQRRGFIYYLSRRAVKFINDIVEEQNKKKHKQAERNPESATASSTASTDHSEEEDSGSDVLDRINDLLNDGQKTVEADDPRTSGEDPQEATPAKHDLSDGFAPLNAFHVRMIAPQIQFQSEKNPKSVLLLTAKSMQLQVIEVMDKDRMADEISGLVQRRFSVDMDSAQFFVTTYKQAKEFRDLYWGNRYGAPQGSSWPPWVPFEVNYDFGNHPFGWSRVVSRTSASLRYEKYNTLRLKYNDEVSGAKGEHSQRPDTAESRIDRLWIEFPHIRAICDSTQYYAMYVIVLDLLLYSEPTEKVRSERLEKIMLASDFSDLRGAPEMVTNLQRRIRQLLEIKFHFQINKKFLDRQGWLDNQALEQDLASCEDELFFMMKAITTSQRKIDDRAEPSQSSPLLQWYLSASEIVWHLMYNGDTPLVEVQFNNAMYNRTDNSDGSNHNRMEIEKMHGLNLLHDAIYPEMLGPFIESGKNFLDGQDPKMFKMSWRMLEAIAGIPVLDQFEVDLFPLKIQLEREIGQKLFEYIFPGLNKKGKDENGGFSPMMIRQSLNRESDDDGSGDEGSLATTSTKVPTLTVNGAANGHAARPASSSSANMRLRATTNFPEKEGMSSSVAAAKRKFHQTTTKEHRFNLFNHANASGRLQQPTHKPTTSQDSLAVPFSRSSTSLATTASSNTTTTTQTPRSSSHDRHSKHRSKDSKDKDKDGKEPENSDDLSLMLSRASNYMTLAYVRIPSVVLSLSYKGKGERNIQDVHDFVFRMPVLEYRNKTWSNLDLALRLKKDVIRALISHTGAIIGNKFAHPRPSQKQRSRLRELAVESQLLASSSASSIRSFGHYPSSDTDSVHSDLPPHSSSTTTNNTYNSSLYPQPSRLSTSSQHARPIGELSRTNSFASSLREHAQQQQQQQQRPQTSHHHHNNHDGEDEEGTLNKFRINLSRKLTSETQKWRGGGHNSRPPVPAFNTEQQGDVGASGGGGDGTAGEGDGDEEKDRKKGVLLLGKRILGNALN